MEPRDDDRSPAPVLIEYATRSGGTTLDQDERGGNPFATALIELASDPDLTLEGLLPRLRALTELKSGRHQSPEHSGGTGNSAWRFADRSERRRERREALVLVVSDYGGLGGSALDGAAFDEGRIAGMLAGHGFSVTQGIGPSRVDLRRALASFRRRSRDADVAIIYSTGHGIECKGAVHLVPGDYPIAAGFRPAVVRGHAVRVGEMASATRARTVNIVFFAGCRTESL